MGDKIFYNKYFNLTVIKDKPSTLKDNIMSIFYTLRYLTIWVLILELLLILDVIPQTPSNIYNILFLQVIVSICAFYIVYIYPKKQIIELHNRTIILENRIMYLFDLMLHHIPLIFMLYFYYTKIYKRTDINRKNIKLNIPIIIFIALVYPYINDPVKLYRINYTIILFSIAAALLLFRI